MLAVWEVASGLPSTAMTPLMVHETLSWMPWYVGLPPAGMLIFRGKVRLSPLIMWVVPLRTGFAANSTWDSVTSLSTLRLIAGSYW